MSTRFGRALGGISVSRLQRELERRSTRAAELRRERETLANRIEALDTRLQAPTLHGLDPGGSVRRQVPVRAGTLHAALHALLRGRQMGVTEAAEAVVKAGYRTKADNFRTIVNACLIRHTNLFTKVAHGLYTAA